MDVETGGVSGLEDELVYSFKLVAVLAPNLAIDPDVRPAPFTIPPTPALMSLTPSPPMPIVSP